MAIPDADRVQPIKWETTADGGSSDEEYPTGVEQTKDALSCRGIYFQPSGAAGVEDEEVYSYRDAATNELRLRDPVHGEISLSDLALDETVKISSNDSTRDYLVSKLLGTSNKITATETNDGSNETLVLDVGTDIMDLVKTGQLASLTEVLDISNNDLILTELESGGAKRKIKRRNLPLPPKHSDGFLISKNSNSQLIIGEGSCRSDDNEANIFVTSNLTLDLSVSGAGGLDTGAEAIETWYHVWLIYNPTTETVSSLFSVSSTSPTLPSGYTKKRRIGIWYNDSLSDLREMGMVHSSGRIRRYTYGGFLSQIETTILSNGQASTWSDLDLSDFIPSTSIGILAFGMHICKLYQNYVDFRVYGSTITQSIYRQYAGQDQTNKLSSASSEFLFRNEGVQTIQYQNSTIDGYSFLWLEGFLEEI